jgi:hypothetical protein
MTDTPRPHDGADDEPDELRDDLLATDAELTLRDLLRSDEVEVDPLRREQAILAALTVADEVLPPATAGPSPEVQPGTEPGEPAVLPLEPPHHPATVVPLASRRPRGLRILAAAAALVLVAAGGLLVSVRGGGDETTALGAADGDASSAGSDAGDRGEMSETAPAPDAESDDAADSTRSSGDADTAGGAASTTTAPISQAAAPEASFDRFPGFDTAALVRLGEQGDLATLGVAAADVAATAPPTTTTGPTTGSFCERMLTELGATPVAIATVGGAPVLVGRLDRSDRGESFVVLGSPGCSVLSRG